MKNLKIIERQTQNVTILDLAGRIRMGEDAMKLRTALRVIAGDGRKNILLNMAEITYIDSSGLGELVAAYVVLKKSGGELKLLHITDRVSELMVITKLLTVFAVFTNEAEAIKSFQEPFGNTVTKQSNFVNEKSDRIIQNLNQP